MKHIFSILIFIFAVTNYIYCQTGKESFEFEYLRSIGQFTSASAFSFDAAGIPYVTDASKNEVYKLDSDGNVLKYAGGYGWDAGYFDLPADVFATMLNIYVADKNNHRISVLDKDLNYLYMLNGRNGRSDNTAESEFSYPASVAVNASGDYLVLDSGNKRILKFDSRGNFLLMFGNYQSGKFQLNNPGRLALAGQIIAVSDDSTVSLFDQYGNGLGSLTIPDAVTGLQANENYLTIYNDTSVVIIDLNQRLRNGAITKAVFDRKDNKIVSAVYRQENLFILTTKEILIYSRKKG